VEEDWLKARLLVAKVSAVVAAAFVVIFVGSSVVAVAVVLAEMVVVIGPKLLLGRWGWLMVGRLNWGLSTLAAPRSNSPVTRFTSGPKCFIKSV
jgi:hypothetical protein